MNLIRRINLGGVKSFFKRYGYYAVLGLTLTILALIVVLAVPIGGDSLDVGGNTVVFLEPVANTTILKNYSASELQFNATLNQWEAHKAVDFVAESGTNVLAAYDGTVQSIYTNYLEGTVIVIDHGSGLKTFYKSLDSNTLVEEGATVEKGDVLGTSSNSAMNETEDGSHVHFEVWKDNQKVDPSAYLTNTDK